MKRPDVPTVFAAESGGALYLMPFLGDCAKPGQQVRLGKVARDGGGIWVVVKEGKAPDDRAAPLVKTSSRDLLVRNEKGLVLQLDGVKPYALSQFLLPAHQGHRLIHADIPHGPGSEARGERRAVSRWHDDAN